MTEPMHVRYPFMGEDFKTQGAEMVWGPTLYLRPVEAVNLLGPRLTTKYGSGSKFYLRLI